MNNTNSSSRAGIDRKMTGEEINALSLHKYHGPISLIKSKKSLTKALNQLKDDHILGFDIETRPAFKKGQSYPPSLLQLAGDKCVCLIQLKRVGLPDNLMDLLESPKIIKAGVGIDFDVIKLREIREFKKNGFVDLADDAKRAGLKNFGLRGLAAVLLGFRIPKGAQRTNWSREDLSEQQLRYAATDAWVGRQIWLQMLENKERAKKSN